MMLISYVKKSLQRLEFANGNDWTKLKSVSSELEILYSFAEQARQITENYFIGDGLIESTTTQRIIYARFRFTFHHSRGIQ